jgi:hypothetical protein
MSRLNRYVMEPGGKIRLEKPVEKPKPAPEVTRDHQGSPGSAKPAPKPRYNGTDDPLILKQVSVQLDIATYQALRDEADDGERTIGQTLRMILRKRYET